MKPLCGHQYRLFHFTASGKKYRWCRWKLYTILRQFESTNVRVGLGLMNIVTCCGLVQMMILSSMNWKTASTESDVALLISIFQMKLCLKGRTFWQGTVNSTAFLLVTKFLWLIIHSASKKKPKCFWKTGCWVSWVFCFFFGFFSFFFFLPAAREFPGVSRRAAGGFVHLS